MSIQALIRGAPQPITVTRPLSPRERNWNHAIRWVMLGGIALGNVFALRREYLWPGVPLGALAMAAYAALVWWQYKDVDVHGGTLSLQPWRYTALCIALVFTLVVVAAPATQSESLWFNIMYFPVLGEARHVPSARATMRLFLLCVACVQLSVLLGVPRVNWPQVSLEFVPLDAGLAAFALSARLQRSQELEHAARLTVLEQLEQSKQRLEEMNYQLQVYAGTVEQLAVANERNRLARDLHDILGYSLATVVVKAEAAKRLLASDPARAREELESVQEVARTGLTEVRRSVAGLRDAAAAAVVWHEVTARFVEDFARQNGLQVHTAIAPLPEEHDPALETCLFRVLQESLTNVARHAHAGHVSVTLAIEEARAHLRVEDDGVGAGPADAGSAGFGIRGMRERVEQLGGRLVFASKRAEGTQVTAIVPLSGATADTLSMLGEAHATLLAAGIEQATPDRPDRPDPSDPAPRYRPADATAGERERPAAVEGRPGACAPGLE